MPSVTVVQSAEFLRTERYGVVVVVVLAVNFAEIWPEIAVFFAKFVCVRWCDFCNFASMFAGLVVATVVVSQVDVH